MSERAVTPSGKARHVLGVRGVAVALVLASMITAARSAEWYVSPAGSDSNTGAIDSPFASIARGQQAASPGDTVWLRGGEYRYSGTTGSANAVLFNKSGAAGAPIRYFAYPGETPAFDFFDYQPVQRIRGFSVQADWLHFRGIEIRGVQQVITNVNESWAIRVENRADNNVFERLNLHHNEGPGLFIADGGNNLVINSDSHNNYDPDRGGENADGFGSHSNDPGNRFVGNRAWNNSDDGFDFINSPAPVALEDSWSWRNGYIPGTLTPAGNGAGVKAGGFGLNSATFPAPGSVPRNLIEGNLSFNNRAQGFYANHHPGAIEWIGNTAFGNPRGFDLLNDVEPETWPAEHYLRNNVSYGNNQNLMNANGTLIDDENNTWNLRAVTADDFLSTTPSGVDSPRRADGSLPVIDFMRLAPGSNLIDAGAALGRPFNGLAPDLGAFESGFAGDFNADGRVDAADYTFWRDRLGPVYSATDYAVWVANYGTLQASIPAAAVPEPAFGAAIPLLAIVCRCGRPIR